MKLAMGGDDVTYLNKKLTCDCSRQLFDCQNNKKKREEKKMTRMGGVSLLLAFLAISFLHGGKCMDIYVDSSAVESTQDGTQQNPYLSMNQTLTNASPGDRIMVVGGSYSGAVNRDLLISFPIEIRAQDFNDRPEFDLEDSGTFATFDPEITQPYGVTGSSIVGLMFSHGKGEGSAGSVLTIVSGSVSVGYCAFDSNIAEQTGAVAVTSSEHAHVPTLVGIVGCSFKGNSGSKGAAISVSPRQSRSVVIGGCSFNENTAEDRGGAIYASGSSLVVVESNFTKNVATSGFGGGISTESSQVKIYSSQFDSNDAAEQGGGVHFDDGSLTLSKSVFTENLLHDAPDQGSLRQGAGAFVTGSALIEGCSFSLNTCSDTSSTSQGGALLLDGDDSSWVSNTSFSKNKAFFGSDIAILSGTRAFFTQDTFERTEEEGMNQIYSSGQVMFENCDFKQTGGDKQALLSAYISGNGALDFQWFPEAPDFEIEALTLLNNAVLKTSTNFNVSVCMMHGGLILSTSSAKTRTFGITEAMVASPVHGSIMLGISSFNMINYGTLTLASAFTFTAEQGWGTFENRGQLFLGEGSTFWTDQFVNYGLLSVDTRAVINADFHNDATANISLNQVVKSSTASLIIVGSARLDGNLEATLNSSTAKDFKKNSQLPLISYSSLEGAFKTFKTSVKSILVYDPTVLYMSNKKQSSDGLGGGEIALTVIGALVGAGILAVAIWYYVVRSDDVERV